MVLKEKREDHVVLREKGKDHLVLECSLLPRSLGSRKDFAGKKNGESVTEQREGVVPSR